MEILILLVFGDACSHSQLKTCNKGDVIVREDERVSLCVDYLSHMFLLQYEKCLNICRSVFSLMSQFRSADHNTVCARLQGEHFFVISRGEVAITAADVVRDV